MSANSRNNFAFIDSSNLHRGVRSSGWDLDYGRFRTYLRDKFGISMAFMFLGYDRKRSGLYRYLQKVGYTLEFKPALYLGNGKLKGNCDAELVLRAMIEWDRYQKAVVVTGDGDFHCLIKHLQDNGKLETLLAPSAHNCSALLKRLRGQEMRFVDGLRGKLEYKKKTLSGRNL